MTDLMEALFEYINKVTLQNYLAVDSDYRISSTRRDTWSLEILDHLDEEGRTLFDRYEKAAFQENSCLLEAMFLATVDLCRELNGRLTAWAFSPRRSSLLRLLGGGLFPGGLLSRGLFRRGCLF